MPQRPRSHQLEDISLRRFESLVPPAWVVRSKTPDYGIDREIEIFEESGKSTGLVFLLQMRATDDLNKARKITLDIEQLMYFRRLQVPTMVVRYCSETDQFFWQWEADISIKPSSVISQKSLTHLFADSQIWNDKTARGIIATLETKRLLSNMPAHAYISVKSEAKNLHFTDAYEFDLGVHSLLNLCPSILKRVNKESSRLFIQVQACDEKVVVSLDAISSVTMRFDSLSQDGVGSFLAYAVAMILNRNRLVRQAGMVARSILKAGITAPTKGLAFEACQALGGDPEGVVELSLLNELHDQDCEFYPLILHSILREPSDRWDREKAVERFYTKALEFASSQDDGGAASVNYSMANFFASSKRFALALRHFNQARKLNDSYLSQGYFLNELGASLFSSGRYKLAAKFYGLAINDHSTEVDFLRLGDALMLSGSFDEAIPRFETSNRCEISPIMHESFLKLLVCEWLMKRLGRGQISRNTTLAVEEISQDNFKGSKAEFERISIFVDPLHSDVNFNLGILNANEGKTDAALMHFLIASFGKSQDVEAWANAAIIAVNLSSFETVVAIIEVSMVHAGREAYDELRGKLVDQMGLNGFIRDLDDLARQFVESHRKRLEDQFTLRAWSDEGVEVVYASS